MSSKTKRTTITKTMLREAARAAHRRTQELAIPFALRPSAGTRRDQAAVDDRVAWARASARARRRGLH